MSSTWIIILIGMIGGNFLLNVAPVGFYVEAVVNYQSADSGTGIFCVQAGSIY